MTIHQNTCIFTVSSQLKHFFFPRVPMVLIYVTSCDCFTILANFEKKKKFQSSCVPIVFLPWNPYSCLFKAPKCSLANGLLAVVLLISTLLRDGILRIGQSWVVICDTMWNQNH